MTSDAPPYLSHLATRRFPVDPFIAILAATHSNRHFVSMTAQVTEGNPSINKPRVFIQPQTHAPRVYFENALGAASLFERVEVLVNGHEVREERMGAHSYLYATLNRLMMTRAKRLKKYGRDVARVSTDADHAVGEVPLPAPLFDSMQSLQSTGVTEAADQIHRFGADGVWPFDSQSNILWALTGVESTNGYLPPEMEITVRLYKRAERTALLQRADQVEADVYTDNAVAVDQHNKVEFYLKDLLIQYEVLTTDAATMAKMKSKTSYFVDVPRVSIDQVEHGKMFSTNVLDLPRGAKFVALAWVWEDEVFLKTSSNKPLAPRFFFAPNAANVTVSFEDGDPGLLFPLGFEELGTEKAQASITSLEYYRQLCHRGLYSRPYEKMFPPHPARSFDQVLLFDLTAHKLAEGAKLYVKVKYDHARGLPGYYLASVVVQQYEYTYHHEKPLICKLVA